MKCSGHWTLSKVSYVSIFWGLNHLATKRFFFFFSFFFFVTINIFFMSIHCICYRYIHSLQTRCLFFVVSHYNLRESLHTSFFFFFFFFFFLKFTVMRLRPELFCGQLMLKLTI